jgi:hypothetical protein
MSITPSKNKQNDIDTLLDASSSTGDAGKTIYPADVKVERETFSFYELKRSVDEYGEMILNPEFQRNKVWTNQQKSDLIESILMNIPLPQFYFAVDKSGIYSVVDGLQRLSAVFDFMDNKYKLSQLAYLNDYSEDYFSALPRPQQAKIEKYQIQAYAIKYPTPEKVKLDIFARINSGGTVLNKQEMRNAMYMGQSTRLLKELSELPEFIRATNRRLNPKRMWDRYLILRFLAFYLWRTKGNFNLEQYGISTELTADFDDFLGRYMQILNKMPPQDIQISKELFKKIMHLACEFYEVDAFVRDKNNRINVVLFESISYIIAFLRKGNVPHNKMKLIIDQIVALEFFQKSMNKSPNSKTALTTHFQKLDEAIDEAL